MKRFFKTLFRLFFPGLGWVCFLIPISGAAVIFALGSNRQTSLFGILSYGLSAYTLAALILGFPAFKGDVKRFIHKNQRIETVKTYLYKNPYTSLYLTSVPARIKLSLYGSLCINLTYAVMKMLAGLYYASFWFGAEAVFYLVLGFVRFIILRNMGKGEGPAHEYKVYRFCGFLLFGLNAALTGIVYQTIHQGRGKEYPGLMIYAAAAYTFFFLISSLVHYIRHRKQGSPIVSAVKVINLTTALVAVYSLQISLFATFGGDETMERIMNSIFGGLLCISIFAMAVFMVVRGFERLREYNGEK